MKVNIAANYNKWTFEEMVPNSILRKLKRKLVTVIYEKKYPTPPLALKTIILLIINITPSGC